MSEGPINEVNYVKEIPRGPEIIFISQSHNVSDLVTAGLVDEDSLYYMSGSKSPHASEKVDKFLQNEKLRKNLLVPFPEMSGDRVVRMRPAQDVLFETLQQQIAQNGNMLEVMTKPPKETLFNIRKSPRSAEDKIKALEVGIRSEYLEAQAIDLLLRELPGPESDIRKSLRESVDGILIKDNDGVVLDADLKVKRWYERNK